MNNYTFQAPMKIIFGQDTLDQIAQDIEGSRIFIVMDRFLYESPLKTRMDTILAEQEIRYFTAFQSNPDFDSINQALREIQAFDATTVIGIGGGSTLDIAKFLSAAIKEAKPAEVIKKEGFQKKAKIKTICIPTTAGTGSEVTNVSVISDYAAHTKSPFVNDLLFADTALLDSRLTHSLPPAVTASCGMDTFCHAIEAYWNIHAQPISDLLAVQAMRRVLTYLEAAVENGTDAEARDEMLQASLEAGLAFAQTRTTILHAVSFPLTSKFKIPHGLACAMLLPSFIRYYGQDLPKMQTLANQLGMKAPEDLAASVETLMHAVQLPVKLSQHGITAADLPQIAAETLQEKIALLGPKPVDSKLICTLLEGILS